MSFVEAIKSYFKNYANFNGRARRSEYWWSFLFTVLVSAALSAAFPGTVQMINDIAVPSNSPIVDLWSIATLLPTLAITWRRLHDAGKPGPYFFYIFIPIAGVIMLLIQLVKDSVPGANRFGDPVK
jgi:uncharacterized membrane protein YhaH (DUF805 family)